MTVDRQYLLLAARGADGETVLYKTSRHAISAQLVGKRRTTRALVRESKVVAPAPPKQRVAPPSPPEPSVRQPSGLPQSSRPVVAANVITAPRLAGLAPAPVEYPPDDEVDMDAVEGWYESRGFAVVQRGWSDSEGAVDLIVRKGGLVVFCEVRCWTGAKRPALDLATRRRIHRMQSQWAGQQARQLTRLRYDVACFTSGSLVVHQLVI